MCSLMVIPPAMSSIIGSQGLVVATAIAVSTSVLFLTFFRQGSSAHNQALRSCLCSDDGRRRRSTKKRVKFSESVKEQTGNGSRRRRRKKKPSGIHESNSWNEDPQKELQKMPANRAALYRGILKDRSLRIQMESSL